MPRRTHAHAVLIALLLAAGPTAAQPAPGGAVADTAVYDLAPVTVRAARPRATPGGASTIEVALDSALVRPAPTLEQVLRTVPLVVVRANSRGDVQPSLRGGEDRQIAVLVDGVPITLAWDHRTDLSVVPLTAARSVTLHRGLSSLLHGPNALAGAVEVDIARGARADAPPPALVLDAGVDHGGARSAALTAGALRAGDRGHWLLRAGGGYRGSDGFLLPRGLARGDPPAVARLTADGDRRLNTDAEAFDGFVSLRRVGTGGGWGSLTGAGYRIERGVAPEAHTASPRLWRYPYQARGLAALAAGTGMRATPWGRGDLEASLGADFGRTEIDRYDGLDFRTVSGDERDDDRTLTARLLGDHTLGDRGDLRLAGTFADVAHREAIDGGPQARYRQRLWSLAAETDWRLPLALPVRVSAGGAADGADTPESADKPPLGRLRDWAARAGASAVLAQGRLVAHASAGRRARFPALRELYSGALGRFLENPALRAETQRVAEAGVTLRHPRGEAQLVGFHQRLDGAITRVAVATPAGNRFQRVNLGRTEARGLEVVAAAGIGAFDVGGSGTLQRVRARDGQGGALESEYEPTVQGALWAESPLPGRARLGVELRGVGRQRYIDIDRAAFATLARSLSVGARITRAFAIAAGPWRQLDVALAVENLGDLPIYDQAGLPQPGRTFRIQSRLW